jgi:hypothetical protein
MQTCVNSAATKALCRIRAQQTLLAVIEPLSSNGRLFLLDYSGFQLSCHNVILHAGASHIY